MDSSLPKILPAGTKVVTSVALSQMRDQMALPAGAVAVVARPPATPLGGRYLLKFANGREVELDRADFRVHSHDQIARSLGPLQLDASSFLPYVIFRCVVGSTAFGLSTDGSDIDRRGVYLPPAEQHWSLRGVPEQFDIQDQEACYWEIQKFFTLALKANPNVLECLYTPLVEFASPLMEEVLRRRDIFLSKLIYQTYNSYVLSQFKKMNKDIENHGEVRPKHAMHLIRLLLSGITILQEGFVPVRVSDDVKERLLAIKSRAVDWAEVNAWRVDLHGEFDEAYRATSLPDHPDYDAANKLLIEARRSMV